MYPCPPNGKPLLHLMGRRPQNKVQEEGVCVLAIAQQQLGLHTLEAGILRDLSVLF